MNIKILNSLTNVARERSDTLIIGTHNGIFHSDEVIACAILCLSNPDKTIQILRSRDKKELDLCDICIDVGGGKFDHHQPGFNEVRCNGIKYASAGLIWKNFGNNLIEKVKESYFSEATCDINEIFKSFDDSIISLVDCEDNGVLTEKHCFSFISSFLPLWFNNDKTDFNNQFYNVLNIAISILKEELKTIIGKEVAKNIIINNWKDSKCFNNGILEIPSQTIDWVETVIGINETIKDNFINFVIFPYPNGGWAAQCVPPSIEERFSQRIPFPHKWAGLTDNLPIISKVDGATFCHNGCFFARAINKESIIKMCNISTNIAK